MVTFVSSCPVNFLGFLDQWSVKGNDWDEFVNIFHNNSNVGTILGIVIHINATEYVHIVNFVENKVIDVIRGIVGMSRLRVSVMILGIGSVGGRFWKGFNVSSF